VYTQRSTALASNSTHKRQQTCKRTDPPPPFKKFVRLEFRVVYGTSDLNFPFQSAIICTILFEHCYVTNGCVVCPAEGKTV
jgi:hypothetical protein